MNISRATAVAKNLTICWSAFLILIGVGYCFEHYKMGSKISPENPPPSPTLEKDISESLDLDKLKEICTYLARERDRDQAINDAIRDSFNTLMVEAICFFLILGMSTAISCMYLWAFLRKQLKERQVSSNKPMERTRGRIGVEVLVQWPARLIGGVIKRRRKEIFRVLKTSTRKQVQGSNCRPWFAAHGPGKFEGLRQITEFVLGTCRWWCRSWSE
jgi:hypothetical protein